jgi:hypothetical protein
MNRRTAFVSLAVLSLLACAFPQASFAQSSSLVGTWKLNLEKSKYSPGTAPRSATNTYQQDGQNIRGTTQVIDAQGNAISTVLMHIYDGQPHPVTGTSAYDARSYTRVDANTLVSATTKGGKLVQVATIVVSQDGKTFTTTTTGILNAAGQAGTTVAVYDKQ